VRQNSRREQYSLSLVTAIAYDEVIANQLVEGGVDSSVFENFVFRLMEHVRLSPKYRGKRVVLLMDNATIHKHRNVLETVMAMRAILMFNPQYSPQLNPVERFFNHMKAQLR